MYRVQGALGLRQTKKRKMSFYGREKFLFELQGALLSAGEKRSHPEGDAFFGTKDAFLPSLAGCLASDLQQKRKEAGIVKQDTNNEEILMTTMTTKNR